MRRWTVIRTGGLAIAAVIAIGALYQVPASPFSRRAYPDRQPVDLGSTVVPAVVARQTPPVPPKSVAPPPVRPHITYPPAGTRRYAVLPGSPAVIGRAGPVMTFQIAIEGGIAGIDRAEFAQFVRATYGGPQGWASQGLWRFQQVGPGQDPDFRLMLVTPATREAICGSAPDRYTSCRIGDQVVLNVARWTHGVRNYGASLTTYRQYMINHNRKSVV